MADTKRTVFDTPFGSGQGNLPLEKGKYRLIWSHTCPWAQRQVIAFKLLGLDDVISLGTVSPVWTEDHEWNFSENEGGVDPVLGIHDLKEAYDKADPDYGGDVIVPTVVDAATGKAVNTDHASLLKYWEITWKPFHKKGAPDLYPKSLRQDIDAFNDVLLKDILTSGYKAAGAETQAAYDAAWNAFYQRMDELEKRLGEKRFLHGDYITDSDLRFYVFLVRHDIVTYYLLGLNRNLLKDFPHIFAYARELYHIPAFHDTTFFADIKRGSELPDTIGNPHGIITGGPDVSGWEKKADRSALSRDPGHIFLEEK